MLEDLNISPRDPKSIHKLSCWLCGTAGDPNRSLSAPAPAASGYHHYHRVWRVGPIKWESKLWQRDLCWNQRKRDPPWLYPNKCLMFWDLQNAPASFFEGILYTPNRGELAYHLPPDYFISSPKITAKGKHIVGCFWHISIWIDINLWIEIIFYKHQTSSNYFT